ncbi:Rnf-Nqr domain containing protein, partial [Shewanella chilikensis]
GRAEAFASRNSPMDAAFDGLMMGIGFTLVLMVLGGGREILGQGTLFDGADLLLGPWAASLRIEVWQVDTPFLLAMLPPGAFLGMGLLIALKNAIDKKLAERQPKMQTAPVERARITKVN